MLPPCLVNGTLSQSLQFTNKVNDEPYMLGIILRQILGNSRKYTRGHLQMIQIVPRARIERILENAAEESEEGGNGIKDQHPRMKAIMSELFQATQERSRSPKGKNVDSGLSYQKTSSCKICSAAPK